MEKYQKKVVIHHSKLNTLEKMAKKNPGPVNKQFATLDSVVKGIELELIDVGLGLIIN